MQCFERPGLSLAKNGNVVAMEAVVPWSKEPVKRRVECPTEASALVLWALLRSAYEAGAYAQS